MRWRRNDEGDETGDDAPEGASEHDAAVEEPVDPEPPPPWSQSESGGAVHRRSDPPIVPVDLAEISDEDVQRALRRAASRALAEDLGQRGDVTSMATVPAGTTGSAEVVARAAGVVAGVDVLAAVFGQLDPRVEVDLHVADGDRVERGSRVATVRGPLRSVLTGERAALNLVGHLSGIATRTRQYVDAVEGTNVAIRDTRKTTPGLRILEKRAVRSGGGHNHRLGLSDAILVKDNHIAAAGSVSAAVEGALEHADGAHVQVEVTNLAELDDAVQAGAEDVLLDNMTPQEVRRAVERARGRVALEVSGGVTLDDVAAYAATGADRIAIGSLTHSTAWLDVALDVVANGIEVPEWPVGDVWGADGADDEDNPEAAEAPDAMASDGDGSSGAEPTTGYGGDARPAPANASEPAGQDEARGGVEDEGHTGGGAGLFAWRDRQDPTGGT